MKHKIGDVVTIRKDLKTGEIYDNMTFVPFMNEFKGREMTIKEVRFDAFALEFHGEKNFFYVMYEDDDEWGWTDAMFEE